MASTQQEAVSSASPAASLSTETNVAAQTELPGNMQPLRCRVAERAWTLELNGQANVDEGPSRLEGSLTGLLACPLYHSHFHQEKQKGSC